MSAAKKAVNVVVILAVIGIIAAFLLPVAINEIESNDSKTISQDTGTTVDVNGELNTTLDSVDTSGAVHNATYTLQSDGQSISKTIDNGTTATYQFNRGDVNVTVNDVNSGAPGNAEATYEYDKDYAYSDGASSLWGLLGLAMVLAVFLLLVRNGLKHV